MEDKKETNTSNPWKMNCGDKCSSCNGMCTMCGHGCGGYKKHFCKKILMLVFILIVFCFGVQIGKLKGELRAMYKQHEIKSGYGYNMMNGYYQGIPR